MKVVITTPKFDYVDSAKPLTTDNYYFENDASDPNKRECPVLTRQGKRYLWLNEFNDFINENNVIAVEEEGTGAIDYYEAREFDNIFPVAFERFKLEIEVMFEEDDDFELAPYQKGNEYSVKLYDAGSGRNEYSLYEGSPRDEIENLIDELEIITGIRLDLIVCS